MDIVGEETEGQSQQRIPVRQQDAHGDGVCCGFDPIYDKADKLTIVILQQQIFYQLQLSSP